jgi:hypothetical protein
MSVEVFALLFVLFVVLAAIVGPLIYWIIEGMALERSRVAYNRWLDELRHNPDDTELREQAIWFGRRYIDVARKFQKSGKLAVFDEFALMNDVNAACARGQHSAASEPFPIEIRLERLKHLHGQGLITDAEYQRQRQRILDEI